MCTEIMRKFNISYEKDLHTSEVFVHPDNRGKLGLNQHNVHRNLGKIKKSGGDGSRLAGATCFELSGNPTVQWMRAANRRAKNW